MSQDKIKTYSLSEQGLSEKLTLRILTTAYRSAVSAVNSANRESKRRWWIFEYRGVKSIWTTSCVKAVFKRAYNECALRKKVHHTKSHGADYFVLDGKALLSFKKMDSKGRVAGFYSKRFKDIMNGNLVHYSQTMVTQLQSLGLSTTLPLYFVGYVVDKVGRLQDVRLVHYRSGSKAYEISLKNLCEENLFTLQAPVGEISVTPKERPNRFRESS
jgi:hypothetical protein